MEHTFLELDDLFRKYWHRNRGACQRGDQHCSLGGHCYTGTYAEALHAKRETARGVLALGVCRGASLAAWAEFFPRAQVHGVDFDTSLFDLDFLRGRGLGKEAADRLHVHEGD